METTLLNQIVAYYNLDTSIVSRIDEFKYVYLVVFKKGYGKRPRFYSKKGIHQEEEFKFEIEEYFKLYNLLNDLPEHFLELSFSNDCENVLEYLNFIDEEEKLQIKSIFYSLEKYDNLLKKVFMIEDIYNVNLLTLYIKVVELGVLEPVDSYISKEELYKVLENFFKYFNYSYQQFSPEEILKSEKFFDQIYKKNEINKYNELKKQGGNKKFDGTIITLNIIKSEIDKFLKEEKKGKSIKIFKEMIILYKEIKSESYKKLLPLFHKYLDRFYQEFFLENVNNSSSAFV